MTGDDLAACLAENERLRARLDAAHVKADAVAAAENAGDHGGAMLAWAELATALAPDDASDVTPVMGNCATCRLPGTPGPIPEGEWHYCVVKWRSTGGAR